MLDHHVSSRNLGRRECGNHCTGGPKNLAYRATRFPKMGRTQYARRGDQRTTWPNRSAREVVRWPAPLAPSTDCPLTAVLLQAPHQASDQRHPTGAYILAIAVCIGPKLLAIKLFNASP